MSEEAEEVALPEQKIETPDYNPQDAYHVRKWELAGKPDVSELDGDGQKWRPSIQLILQEDGKSYLPRPLPEPNPVTDVEILYKKNADRLNSDEAKRTGRAVDPDGSVPVARAMAATAMLYGGWSYPSEADLSKGINPQILQAIYADPTMKTSEESSADQKRRVLHFTLVMLEGQKFGLDYQGELGAYERTASGQFRAKIKDDKTRDWLELPCPKMHKAWPEFPTVRDMFLTVMA